MTRTTRRRAAILRRPSLKPLSPLGAALVPPAAQRGGPGAAEGPRRRQWRERQETQLVRLPQGWMPGCWSRAKACRRPQQGQRPSPCRMRVPGTPEAGELSGSPGAAARVAAAATPPWRLRPRCCLLGRRHGKQPQGPAAALPPLMPSRPRHHQRHSLSPTPATTAPSSSGARAARLQLTWLQQGTMRPGPATRGRGLHPAPWLRLHLWQGRQGPEKTMPWRTACSLQSARGCPWTWQWRRWCRRAQQAMPVLSGRLAMARQAWPRQHPQVPRQLRRGRVHRMRLVLQQERLGSWGAGAEGRPQQQPGCPRLQQLLLLP